MAALARRLRPDVTAGLRLAPALAGVGLLAVLTVCAYYESPGLALILLGAYLIAVAGWVWRDLIARRQLARLRVVLATERAWHQADLRAERRRFERVLQQIREAQAVTALMHNGLVLEEARRHFAAGQHRGAA